MKKYTWFIIFIFSFNVFSNTLQPTLSNFRILQGEPTRVYFDSNVEITGSTHSGFVIGSNSIMSTTIREGDTNGHYFTVSKPFTFWDNNLIRYEGGSNLQDIGSNLVNPFPVTFIKNNIKEPKGDRNVYFVTTIGNDNNTGSNEKNAWRTLTYAASKAQAGDVVYIKSGDYGDENVIIKNNGSSERPIKFIGYKETSGDEPILNRAVNLNFNSSEMPLIKNGRANGITCVNKAYIIIRNIQIENYDNWGIKLDNSNYVMIDNVYLKDLDIGIRTVDKNSTNNRVVNSFIANCKSSAVRLDNKNNLIDNVWAVSSRVIDMDYYLSINGGLSGENNIIRNCYIERFENDSHGGHGFSFKAGDPTHKIQYSLIENSEVVNCGGAIEFRHSGVKFNVARNIKIRETKQGQSKGIKIRESASNNLVENCDVSGEMGIRFDNNVGEDLGDQIAGSNNKIVNSVFHDLKFAVFVNEGLPQNRDNEFINCTFFNIENLYSQAAGNKANKFDKTNKFVNCAFEKISKEVLYGNPSFTIEYSNFWNYWKKNGTAFNGNSNISVLSGFENSSKGNFRLQSTSKLIDAGKRVDELILDCDQNQRPQGKSHDIGAFEYFDNSDTRIYANAGEDVSICKGEEIVLTATGGSKYLWSTNEETASIKISPLKTTTYSVRVSDGSLESTDEVTVTVNEVIVDAGEDVSINLGESIILTAAGGAEYEWDNGETTSTISVSPMVTTSFLVTAFNNGCEDTDEVIVFVNNVGTPTIVANAGEDVSICKGEEVVLTASGGDTYRWSSGEEGKRIKVSPDKTTTYSVIVSKGSLEAIDDVTVTVNEVVADAGEDASVKLGEKITLTAKGGTTYKWNNGEATSTITVSPKVTTFFIVTAYKNGCEDTDEVIVYVDNVGTPTIEANAGEDVSICKGEEVVLTASGGDTYRWSSGEERKSITVSPDNTTTYSVIAYKGSMVVVDEVTVTVNEVIADAGDDKIIEEGKSIELTASGGDTYLWSTGESSKQITVDPLETTIYTVQVFKGECSDEDSVKVSTAAKNDVEVTFENLESHEINVYPNPASGILNVEARNVESDLDIHLININGQILYHKKMNAYNGDIMSKQLNLQRFTKGVYYVRFTNLYVNEVKKIVLI